MDEPADAGAANGNCDLTLLEVGAGVDVLGVGTGLGDPEVVVGVGIDADIGLEAGSAVGRGTHCGGPCEVVALARILGIRRGESRDGMKRGGWVSTGLRRGTIYTRRSF